MTKHIPEQTRVSGLFSVTVNGDQTWLRVGQNFEGSAAILGALDGAGITYEDPPYDRTEAEGARRIPLSRGLFVTVDAADYELLVRHRWCAVAGGTRDNPKFFPGRSVRENGRSRMVLMGREIMRPGPGQVVDYANGDTLDCRRDNLRVCTRAEASLNRVAKRSPKGSRFKGVYFHRKNRRWVAEFRGRCLGSFGDETEAAQAYDAAARRYKPAFALLNFPAEGPTEAERRARAFDAQPRQQSSRHFGVTWNRRQGKWLARWQGKHLGTFASEDAAAAAVQAAAQPETA